MTDYYKLFDYCKKTTEQNNIKKERAKKNKESRQKKYLFKIITENAYNIIKNSVNEGNDYAIIYDNDYNKLIEELMDSLVHHFKPFSVVYKKKNFVERGLFEVLKDESNYILIIDWNTINNNKIQPLNTYYNENNINEIKNSEEKIDKKIDINLEPKKYNFKTSEKIIDKKIDTKIENNFKNYEEIIGEKIETKIDNNFKADTFLEKLGFEAIF